MKTFHIPASLLLVASILLGVCVGAMAQEARPRYKLTDLGALSKFANSRAYGINNKGQVVGQVATLEPKLEAHAVLWDGDKVTNIMVPEGLALSVGHGINELGQIVGGAEIQNYGSQGFHFMGMADQAYSWNGQLNVLGLNGSHAYAVNNGGQVVGEADKRAMLWEKNKATLLASLPYFLRTSARAVNNSAQVAGIGWNKEGKRQAVWWSEGKMQSLGTLPGDDQSIACALNDIGVVVGSSGKDNSYSNLPFIWQNGKMEILSPLEGRTWLNEASAINNRNQIVGYGMMDGAYMHAVLWESRLPGFWMPRDLNDLIAPDTGLVLMKAVAINDQGQIVGEARDSKTQIHAFLLTPIPEVR